MSNVLKRKRNLSKVQFYTTAVTIRDSISTLLLKDFGIRDKVRSVNTLTVNMEDEDVEVFEDLAQKYGVSHVLDEFPPWFIEHCRENLLYLLRELVWTITLAYSIYPVYESEYYKRRDLQNQAIGICEQLFQEMQFVLRKLPCDANKYMPYVDMIVDEIELLKKWRGSCKKDLNRIQNNNSQNLLEG